MKGAISPLSTAHSDPETGTAGLLDAALVIARKRAAIVAKMHEAVAAGDLQQVFELATELTGAKPQNVQPAVLMVAGALAIL